MYNIINNSGWGKERRELCWYFYMEFSQRSDAWWGEGEVKFYFDGDKEFLTITLLNWKIISV